MPDPIHPTRVIPAGAAPPLPPRPPAPPAVMPPGGGWPPAPRYPQPPTVPQPVQVEVLVRVEQMPAVPEPEPGPGWRERWRPGYNAACALAATPIAGYWAMALTSCRHDALGGAWVLAAVPLGLTAWVDNLRRIEAAGANPDLWAPKIRAAVMRILLWAQVIAIFLALPVDTATYLITGVQS